MPPTVQVSWARERRLALEAIVKAVIPDVHPAIRFRLNDGAKPLHALANPGLHEGTRLFEVWSGPCAGAGPMQLGQGAMNGNTFMNVTNYYRIDVRYGGNRTIDATMRMDWNDMMHTDSEKLLHAIAPSESGVLWGDVPPYRWTVANLVVDNPPDLDTTPRPWAIMRMLLGLTYDIGRNGNY